VHKRKLGNHGLEVSCIGLGCMGMSWAYGQPATESEAVGLLHRAADIGLTFWDTAEAYGPYKNEDLLGKAIRGLRRENIIIATKFASEYSQSGQRLNLNGKPAHVRTSIEGSLRRLGIDYIDLYYQHRLDPETPVEETVGAMGELVKEGKVRYLGLSEVGPNTIRRAHGVHPISVIQSEFSIWEREVETLIRPVLKELGIGFVAYSPVGRGYLTGKIKSIEDFDANDTRRNNPRFQDQNLKHNSLVLDAVKEIAVANEVTPAQVALAWVLRQGTDYVPIPGTKRLHHMEENSRAASIHIQESAWVGLSKTLASFKTAGARYTDEVMKTINSD
jgi:aryl-alcohol dehydrogenase-like predicted oxidoreductase